ncbi:MAG: hypothetical protein ACLSHU_07510 [Oscillospiraceae bacterium]
MYTRKCWNPWPGGGTSRPEPGLQNPPYDSGGEGGPPEGLHPDYKEEKFTRLQVGPNAGEKVPLELAELLQSQPRFLEAEVPQNRRISLRTC